MCIPALTINPRGPMITINFHVQIFETQKIQDSKPLARNPIGVPIEGLMVKFSGNGSLGQINLTFPGYYYKLNPRGR